MSRVKEVAYETLAAQRIADLEYALSIALEFIETYSDVVDGDDGQLEPNHAMSLMSEIQNILEN
jgi:hypothetical protein